MNYSSMVEQSTHNGCISVQFWVIQTYLLSIRRNINKYKKWEHDVGSDLMLCRGITHASKIFYNILRTGEWKRILKYPLRCR